MIITTQLHMETINQEMQHRINNLLLHVGINNQLRVRINSLLIFMRIVRQVLAARISRHPVHAKVSS
jgi:hypothetical protein